MSGTLAADSHPLCDHCGRINTKSRGKIRGLARSKVVPALMLCSRCYNRCRVDGHLPDLNKSKVRKRATPTSASYSQPKRKKVKTQKPKQLSNIMDFSTPVETSGEDFSIFNSEKDFSTPVETSDEESSDASMAPFGSIALTREKRERRQRRQSLDEGGDAVEDGLEWTPESEKKPMKLPIKLRLPPIKPRVSAPVVIKPVIKPEVKIPKWEVIASRSQTLKGHDCDEFGWADDELCYDQLYNFFKHLEPRKLEPFMKLLVAEGYASGEGNEVELNVSGVPFDLVQRILEAEEVEASNYGNFIQVLQSDLNKFTADKTEK